MAAPCCSMAYCGDVQAVAQAHSFLPSDRGANVILLEPFDPVVWDRTRKVSLVTYASVSQVVVDCLTGNGRMPSEGGALLSWMIDNESEWRSPSLNDVQSRASDVSFDPLYVEARQILLDALVALAPHGDAVIVVGAQAVYLRTNETELAIAPYTTDGDLRSTRLFSVTIPSLRR